MMPLIMVPRFSTVDEPLRSLISVTLSPSARTASPERDRALARRVLRAGKGGIEPSRFAEDRDAAGLPDLGQALLQAVKL
jgi:hypothetical protein